MNKLLDAGELGDRRLISACRVNLGIHQRDVSVLWDPGPHDFSISPRVDSSEPLALEIEDLLLAARHGNRRSEPLQLALSVVRMIEAAEISLPDGGEPTRVEEPAARELVP